MGGSFPGMPGGPFPGGGVYWGPPERHGNGGPWDESVRTVDLPELPNLNEGEIGPLAAGDWLALIAPVMKDLSSSSASWWDAIVKEAVETYEKWLHAEPLARIQLHPALPGQCGYQPWLRLEQRGSTMLLKALPEEMRAEALASRATSSVGLVYRVLKKYQPGGLGERTHLLKQLVEARTPGSVQEMIHQLQMWRRWVRRAKELRINIPDPTLLIGTLDKMSAPLVRASAQVAFRLSTVRAQLLVDVRPSLEGVMSFAETLQAEGEVVFLSGEKSVGGPKVKALGTTEDRAEKPRVQEDSQKKDYGRKSQQPCRFFLSEKGCKKGASCSFLHEADGKQRCWQCGSLEHMRKDCPVKSKRDEEDRRPRHRAEATAERIQPQVKQVSGGQKQPTVEEMSSDRTATEAEKPRSGTEEAIGGLLKEATGLLKSLNAPSLKSLGLREGCPAKVSALGMRDRRALLDGGATHCLRQVRSGDEWRSATEVEVELAQGTVRLRQLPGTRTLVTEEGVQPLVPLGLLAEMGYAVHWEGSEFSLQDPSGRSLAVELVSGCPTVSEEAGLRLIREVEGYVPVQKTRLAVLREKGDLGRAGNLIGKETVRWLERIRGIYPEVPEETEQSGPKGGVRPVNVAMEQACSEESGEGGEGRDPPVQWPGREDLAEVGGWPDCGAVLGLGVGEPVQSVEPQCGELHHGGVPDGEG